MWLKQVVCYGDHGQLLLTFRQGSMEELEMGVQFTPSNKPHAYGPTERQKEETKRAVQTTLKHWLCGGRTSERRRGWGAEQGHLGDGSETTVCA